MRAHLFTLLLLACDRPETTDDGTTDDSPAESKPPDDSASDDSPADDSPADDSADDSGLDTSVPESPRRVILFIGDGMGPEHVRGAGMYGYGAEGTLSFEGFPNQGRLRTASFSGITDSAASATVYSTGHKTFNGRLGLDADSQAVFNMMERARAHGMSVGIVTTDKLTGATPSAFVVHVEDRGDDAEIAAAYQADMPDVSFAGGADAFTEILPNLDVNLATTGTALAALVPDGRKVLGLFAGNTFPFVADGYNGDEPTLAAMTQKALELLDQDEEGFFLMVESARIDHASHGNMEAKVFDEVLALDAAVAVADAYADANEATIVVTADHECGGLRVSGAAQQGIIPTSDWRWGRHTNRDIPVYGRGPYTEALDGLRQDQLWVNAVLMAALDDHDVEPPDVPPLIDGFTEELGPVVVRQSWNTNFGPGFNQLDALHVHADPEGLRVGVDGVFERDDNAVYVLVDLDYGAGTGLGADTTLSDVDGRMDAALSALRLSLALPGLGFDLAYGAMGASETEYPILIDGTGIRGWSGTMGSAANFGWWQGVSNFDDGNVAEGGVAAPDADATGQTENGYELVIPWSSAFQTGIPTSGASLALVVVLVNEGGDFSSNQALPPLASSAEVGADPIEIVQVVRLSVDAAGNLLSGPALEP